MFFTLVSRTVITQIRTPRDYLYIFLIGSVGYVALHWYLHMEKREGIVEKIREYLYYTMVIDIITAFALSMVYPPKPEIEASEEESNETNKNENNNNKEEYTEEQKRAIMQKMQDAKRLQQQRMKEMNAQNGQKPADNPEKTNEPKSSDAKQQGESTPVPTNNKKTSSAEKTKENSKESNKNAENVNNDDEDGSNEPKRSIFTKSTESNDDDEEEEKEKETKEKVDATKINVKGKSKDKEESIQDTEIPVYDSNKKKNKK